MTHIAIYGQTLSGKSTLAKRLAAKYKNNGIGVLVYDPVYDPEWDCDFKTPDFQEFLRVYWTSESCMVFIDEASMVCQHHAADAIKTATMGRHRGHINHYISQRANLMDKTIRDQTSHLFLFNSGNTDCKMHAEEWNVPDLKNGTSLKVGQYYHAKKMGGYSLNYLFENEEKDE